ncbi:hypothetical protein GE21DRAFT_1130512 [Neurospora crassa]|nr:hypothetical protein GE21DRAFT_1130512 [Neurospora crassa]
MPRIGLVAAEAGCSAAGQRGLAHYEHKMGNEVRSISFYLPRHIGRAFSGLKVDLSSRHSGEFFRYLLFDLAPTGTWGIKIVNTRYQYSPYGKHEV